MTVVNREQFDAWNGDSGRRWAQEADRRDAILAPIAAALLASANLTPGEHVLDIGCGCGATTLAAARTVTGSGSALGVDLSAPMLGVARHRAEALMLANARFEQADMQTHAWVDERFDAVVSRFGTMFFSDPDSAFANIAAAMRPRSRLCIATWQPLTANDWLMVPLATLLQFGSLPEIGGGPGMFGQSDPAGIERTLTEAGLIEVNVQPVTVSLRLGRDSSEAADYLCTTGPGAAMLETVEEQQRTEPWRRCGRRWPSTSPVRA